MSPEPSVLGLSLWLIGTAGHYVLTARWTRTFGLAGPSRDERWFVTMLAATGTLVLLLHVVAATVSLSLAAVLVPLATGHAALAVMARRQSRPHPAHREASPLTPTPVAVLLEGAAILVFTTTVFAWLAAGSTRLEVSGTDAAHYHVPVAVNLALGASPLDLPATQHLYPMATSTLAAWFLIPTGDALLVELVMIVPFLLAAASLGWAFRLVTGESGLAWCSWLTLLVFSMPMFRQASLMSADLLFAAAFAALIAQVLSMGLGARDRPADVLLVGLATGLVIGAKTTGLVAAAILLGLAVVAVLWRRPLPGLVRPRQFAWWGLAGLLALGAGGIWLLRNWWLFGSPVAPTGLSVFGIEIFRGPPLEATTYLSALGDLEADPEYSLAGRASSYISEWFGRWYLLLMAPVVLVPVDALVRWLKKRPGAIPRVLLLTAVCGTGVPMVWLLIGAPWTSLEWTRGMALRYALPWFLLLPFVAWVGLFPASVPWFRRSAPALVLGGVAAAASLVLLTEGPASRPFPPAVTWPAFAVAVAGWSLIWFGHRVWRHAALAAGLVVLIGWAAWLTDHDPTARDAARAARAAAAPTPTQRLYTAVLRAESALGRECASRRFFALTRFDEPLGVQSVEYRNLVFYAAREVQATARAVEPMGACDYIVSTRAMLETEKAADLVRVLNPYGRTAELGSVGALVLLGQL